MKRWLPALLIVLLLAGFRLLGSIYSQSLPNFQPLPALLLCGVVFLKGPERWLLPLTAWLITDPLTSLAQHNSILGWHNLSVPLGLVVTAGIALLARRRPTLLPVLGSSILAALAFYFVTNLVSFVVDPLYAKTWNGFVQCQWTGPAGMGSTWPFLRNMLAANLLFSGLFMAARQSLPQVATKPSRALAR